LTHAPSGTGLGLYISRELARRMGGRLYLDPAPDSGATFVLELPRV
jgi:signal transduction histidine kinase